MILDIIVCCLVVFAMVSGFRHGFVRTFLHVTGWLISLAAAFVLAPKVKDFLIAKTDFYDSVNDNILLKFSGEVSNIQSSWNTLPQIVTKSLDQAAADVSLALAESISLLIFTIISFFVVIFVVKLALWLITCMFSKERNHGITGIFDGILGLVFGFIKGILFVYILLFLMVPIASLSGSDAVASIMDALSSSRLALDMYNNNLLLLIVQDLLV